MIGWLMNSEFNLLSIYNTVFLIVHFEFLLKLNVIRTVLSFTNCFPLFSLCCRCSGLASTSRADAEIPQWNWWSFGNNQRTTWQTPLWHFKHTWEDWQPRKVPEQSARTSSSSIQSSAGQKKSVPLCWRYRCVIAKLFPVARAFNYLSLYVLSTDYKKNVLSKNCIS